MKRTALLCLVWLAIVAVHAGIDSYYDFSWSLAPYESVNGTVIQALSADDEISAPIDLGFAFPYGEYAYNHVRISTNGWIGLGSSHNSSYHGNDLSLFTPNPIIAPLWDDLSMDYGLVEYLLMGNAPDRIFTVQYTAAKWNYAANNLYDFQVRLHENGSIYLIYGSCVGEPQSASASVGINMLPGGSDWFYSVTPGTPHTASTTVSFNGVNDPIPAGTRFHFTPVQTYANDLACLSLSGMIHPTVGTVTPYTALVSNPGSLSQDEFVVKLYDSQMNELDSVTQGPLPSGGEVSVQLLWAPEQSGHETLYAKVVLEGDEHPANDQCPGLAVNAQVAGMQYVTIGNGNEQERYPMDFYFKNSLYECIYTAAELGVDDAYIYSIGFFNNFVDTINGATRIWLGNTGLSSLSADWIPSTELTPVFDGILVYPEGQNTVTIELSTPFRYTGGNLVMLVQRPMDSTCYHSGNRFYCQQGTLLRARYARSDVTSYDPANPPAGSAIALFPKTSFAYVPYTSAEDPAAPEFIASLQGNSPNPFKLNTEIRFTLGKASLVRLSVYNLKGQLVRSLLQAEKNTGQHHTVWDGRDDRGKPVASGVYLYRLQANGFDGSGKMLLIR